MSPVGRRVRQGSIARLQQSRIQHGSDEKEHRTHADEYFRNRAVQEHHAGDESAGSRDSERQRNGRPVHPTRVPEPPECEREGNADCRKQDRVGPKKAQPGGRQHAEDDGSARAAQRCARGRDDASASRNSSDIARCRAHGCTCRDGHDTVPYEQNTQQSPAFGRSIAWHAAHSWKNRHASIGTINSSAYPQAGQVIDERRGGANDSIPQDAPARIVTLAIAHSFMYTQRMSRHSGFRSRVGGVTLLLSMCYLVLLGSGFGCTWASSTSSASMSAMGMAGTPQRTSHPHDRAPSGCQLPWAPNGCQTMAPCAPAALESVTFTLAASAATPEAAPPFVVIAPRSLTRAPELPPPRA